MEFEFHVPHDFYERMAQFRRSFFEDGIGFHSFKRQHRDFKDLPPGWSYEIEVRAVEVELDINGTAHQINQQVQEIARQAAKVRRQSLAPIEGEFRVVETKTERAIMRRKT